LEQRALLSVTFLMSSSASASHTAASTSVVGTTVRKAVAQPAPRIVVQGLGQTIVNNDKTPSVSDGTSLGTAIFGHPVSHTFTILNQGAGPLSLTGKELIKVSGNQPGDFRITGLPTATIAPGGSTTFTVLFTPGGKGLRQTTLTIATSDPTAKSFKFTVSGTGVEAPPVLSDAAHLNHPSAGLRVKMVEPGFAATSVYHTLYLPTDWKPGKLYPVIVEFPPNKWSASGTDGTVDDTMLGYYQSGGHGFIWISMPIIKVSSSSMSNSTYTWGSSFNDQRSMQTTADYTKAGIIDVLEQWGGDPSEVFATGFSRGAVATSIIGLRDAAMADIWAGFMPHSFADTDPTRLGRIAGRASFITWGTKSDQGAPTSQAAVSYLLARGYSTIGVPLTGYNHTDLWIRDDANAIGQSVRTQLRTWLDGVIKNHTGTHSIHGTVVDTDGTPLAGVRVQSGSTHWTYTDTNGHYDLAGLISSSRTITASYSHATLSSSVVVGASDVAGKNFTFTATT
jgi:hypothetical protein